MKSNQMRHNIPMIAVLIVACIGASVAGDQGSNVEPPIQAKVKDRGQGKGCYLTVDLKLANNRGAPVWFVSALRGNQLLRHDGTFSGEYDIRDIAFQADVYDEGSGAAILVNHFGKDSFRAILVPAEGRFHFGGYVIDAQSPIRFVDVWEVRSLKVNGKTSLEDWLPYDVMSSASVEISGAPALATREYLASKSKNPGKRSRISRNW